MKRFAGYLLTAAAMFFAPHNVQAGWFDPSCGCEANCDTSGCTGACGCGTASGCDSPCGCDSLGGCDSCGLGGCLSGKTEQWLSLLRKSDHCFDDFISPMINPVFFEDPRTLTELRPIYIRHETPNRLGTLGLPGGNIQLFAAQFRIALTERLSLIATKDGYIVSDIGGPLGDLLDDGWADVSAGLKYNLLRNPDTGTLWSIGGVYEIRWVAAVLCKR